jgi:hypothetical protein
MAEVSFTEGYPSHSHELGPITDEDRKSDRPSRSAEDLSVHKFPTKVLLNILLKGIGIQRSTFSNPVSRTRKINPR